MSAPEWMVPEGCHEVARARIERDWRDSRRAIRDVRRYVAANKASIDAEWNAIPDVPRTIEQHQQHARELADQARQIWPEALQGACREIVS